MPNLLLSQMSTNGSTSQFLSGPRVYSRTATQVIERLNPAVVVAPAYSATQNQKPAGYRIGKGSAISIECFAASVTGQLIKSEGFNSGDVSYYWNDNNTEGDPSFTCCLAGEVRDLGIEGKADLVNYPYSIAGAHGYGFTPWADGLCLQGTGWQVTRVALNQIPGIAVVIKGGGGEQAGSFSRFDSRANRLSHIFVEQSYGGISAGASDMRVEHSEVVNVVTDALTITGPGARIIDSHNYGADRACVVNAPEIRGYEWYHEAARIGTEILFGSDGGRVVGLNTGDRKCWSRGVKISSDNFDILGLTGGVMAEGTDGHSGIVGCEIGPSHTGAYVEGDLSIYAGSTGILVGDASHHNRILFRPTTNGAGAIGVKVLGAPYGNTFELDRGYIPDGGVALDLSGSTLNSNSGQGNTFIVKNNIGGTGKAVWYPGYPTTNPSNTYNLHAGNYLYIDGVLQS